jgi:hypothetical protein
VCDFILMLSPVAKLPTRHFVAIEATAQAHTPKRVVIPDWGVDVFEDEA